MIRRLAIVLALAALATVTAPRVRVAPMFSFTYSRTVTIDHTQVPNTDQTNFPVLVLLTNADFKTTGNGGLVTNANGYDLVFYSDSSLTSVLKFEMLSYTASTGAIVAWVKVPTVSHTTDTVIYIGYGNSAISTYQGDNANTWSNSYLLVYHMADNAASTTVLDSVGSNNAANNANTSGKTTAAKFNNGLIYNGTSDITSIAYNLSTKARVFVQFWMWWDTYANNDKLACEYGPNPGPDNFYIDPNSSGGAGTAAGNFDVYHYNGFSYNAAQYTRPSAAAWHNYAFDIRRGSGTTSWVTYIDGAVATSAAGDTSQFTGNFGNLTLTMMGRSGGSLLAAGRMQEFRLTDGTRSADWVAAQYNNENSPSTFVTLGGQSVLYTFPPGALLPIATGS